MRDRMRALNRRARASWLAGTCLLLQACMVQRVDPGREPTPDALPSVTFLAGDDARTAIGEDARYPYFSRLQPLEMSAITGRLISGDTLETQRTECRARHQAAVRDFTETEKEMLRWTVSRIQPALAADYPAVAVKPWKFVKVTDDIQGGLPHTRNDFIVLSEGTLRMAIATWEASRDEARLYFLNGLGFLLLHEQLHVFQRQHPERFDGLYTDLWGFQKAQAIEGCPWLERRQLVNPDAPDCPWVISIKSDGGGTRTIWPLVILNNDGRVPPRMPGSMAMVALTVEKNDQGFKVVLGQAGDPQREPLNDIAEYVDALRPARSIYHPAEAAADLFAMCLLLDHFLPPASSERTAAERDKVQADVRLVRSWFAEHLRA